MGLLKPKVLPLRELSKILRPLPTDQLLIPESWSLMLKEFEAAADVAATGIVLLSAPLGAGKTSFLKALQATLSKHEKIHTIFGAVAESIPSRGWLMPFLSDVLAGSNGPILTHRGVIERLSDLSSIGNTLVLLLDGINMIATDAVISDLGGLAALIEDSSLQLLVVLAVDEHSARALESNAALKNKGLMNRPLPALDADSIRKMLERRLKIARMEDLDYKSHVEECIVQAKGNPGAAIRVFIENSAKTLPQVLESPKSKVGPVQPDTKLKKSRNQKHEATSELAEAPKSNSKLGRGKSESKQETSSYDDLLTIRRHGA